jgi:hypothetical protein
MVKRILVLTAFLIVPPFLFSLACQLLVKESITSSYWTSSLPKSIVVWATFGGAVAEFTGYSLRDFIAYRGRWQYQSSANTNDSEGIIMEQNRQEERKRIKRDLKAAEERKDELERKSLRYGPRSLDAGEFAELEKLKDETIPQLEEKLERLER